MRDAPALPGARERIPRLRRSPRVSAVSPPPDRRAAGCIDRPHKHRSTAMGLFTKDIKTLDDLFVHTLQDIYYAEHQITKALPKMAGMATDPQLRQGFETHLRETEGQIRRLEQVFEMHGQKPKQVDCPTIDGLIKEANEIAGEVADKEVLDAALLAAAQSVEHYEISRYGTLVAWAKQLGRNDCATILAQNLEEEKATDKKLTAMAEAKVNKKAA
jgi:ferritin-like metal-binding protein YciE